MSEGIAYGDYYLLGRLGSGGMAEVFLGKRLGDEVGGALLAVKRLSTQFSGDADLVKAFQGEARLGKLLRHPNIVEVVESGDNAKQQFLVMEFIHGKDLKAVQQRARKGGSRLPYIASAYIIAAIADALAYAHAVELEGEGSTIVHRDLSPQKIIISYEGVPKLLDFSARDAKSRGIEGRLSSLKGRFGYMSPEQATSSPVGQRSDIFSLGIILYELTTGMAPFRGGSDAATVGKVARASYSPPELVNASIPRELAKVIERAMQRDPDKRFATAGEMAQALRDFIRDDGQVIDKGELARIMRELFFEDYERERVRVEQYRRLTPMGTTPSGSKPVAMGDSESSGGPEGSRTSNDERTTADEQSLATIDDDDDTGVSASAKDALDDDDTGIGVPDSDTGVHDAPRETTDTGVHAAPDTSMHDVEDTGLHAKHVEFDSTKDAPADEPHSTDEIAILTPVSQPVATDDKPFQAYTEELLRLPVEPTNPVEPVTELKEPTNPGDFSMTAEEVVPKLSDDEITNNGTGPIVPAAIADNEATAGEANPWAVDQMPLSTTFVPPQPMLSEGPTVVAASLFDSQSPESPFQVKTPTARRSVFDEKTKVYEGVADLVRRTQPRGFGIEITKEDKPGVAATLDAHPAQIGEVIDAMNPLAVATTVQVMHVATVVATPPEKQITEVAIANPLPKPKRKKTRGGSKADAADTEDTQNEDSEFLDDEAFAKSGPLPEKVVEEESQGDAQVPRAVFHEQPDDLEPYDDDDGRYFSRSDMITLVVAAFMGLLIMTASYVYALNVPLPDQDTIIDDR